MIRGCAPNVNIREFGNQNILLRKKIRKIADLAKTTVGGPLRHYCDSRKGSYLKAKVVRKFFVSLHKNLASFREPVRPYIKIRKKIWNWFLNIFIICVIFGIN